MAILVNAVFNFAQEHRAERAVEALGPGAAPAGARPARRPPAEVDARELVPGDVTLLAPGTSCSSR